MAQRSGNSKESNIVGVEKLKDILIKLSSKHPEEMGDEAAECSKMIEDHFLKAKTYSSKRQRG